MEREEFKILVKGMKAVYAQPTFIPDQDAFNVWYALLQDLPYQTANLAIQKYMLTEKYPPTIADIREKALGMSVEETSIGELEAWALVKKAISNSGYHAEEEFAKLPEACQIAIGRPAVLREWATMENFAKHESVEQSHFINGYKAAVKRMKDDAKIPQSIRNLIAESRGEAQKVDQKPVPEIAETEKAPKPSEGIPMPEKYAKRLEEMFKEVKT